MYPMVTIRISDRHRLIQPYIHNYSWLLFAALALYTSELSSEKRMEGEALDGNNLSQASALQTCCSQLITDCLLKGQTGKGKNLNQNFVLKGKVMFLSFHGKPFHAILHVGLRSSALLALLSSNESASDSELCPVSPESSPELSTATDTSSLPGSTAAICSPSSPKDKVRKRSCVVR